MAAIESSNMASEIIPDKEIILISVSIKINLAAVIVGVDYTFSKSIVKYNRNKT